jgi:uncharacterized protein
MANENEKKTPPIHTILWRRLDTPGHEASRCYREGAFWHLAGTSVFVHDGRSSRLDYVVVCDAAWQTVSGSVRGWVGDETVVIDISVDASSHWRLNGIEIPGVAGCSDIDLNFSPSTNLRPIRRTRLAVGQDIRVAAAWLRFPSFTLERLEQRYRRLDAVTYRYESAGGAFTTELRVNAAGFVTLYPNFFEAETES